MKLRKNRNNHTTITGGKEINLNKIKEFRKRKNLSQSDIARMLGIKQNTFSQWETGKRKPDVLQGIKLAKILNTTVESLYK